MNNEIEKSKNPSDGLGDEWDVLRDDTEYQEVYEKFRFDGDALFVDIDGTLTDNTGEIDERAVEVIKKFMASGGAFVPVTGRARFESVRSIVETLDLPFIIINNGAEIFNREGERIYGSEIPDEQVNQAYDIADEENLIWMQNKRDPETGEEHLYSNFTEESEKMMKEVGIKDTVHNEEGRIGLKAKHATSDEVMAIPGQNYKIQMMSPDADAVQGAYDKFVELDIPCMLNMQSEKTGRFHWVEVIKGTKINGIQKLIDDYLPGDVKVAQVIGDGGNDLTMFKELHNREGDLIPNTYVAVANACDKLKEQANLILKAEFDKGGERKMGMGGAIVEAIDNLAKTHEIEAFLRLIEKVKAEKGVKDERVVEMIDKFKSDNKIA